MGEPLALRSLWGADIPSESPTTTVDVVGGGAAEAAGVRAGDRIIAIDGRAIERWDEIPVAIADRSGDTVRVSVVRGIERLEIVAEVSNGKLGVVARTVAARVPPAEAALMSAGYPLQLLAEMVRPLVRSLASDSVSLSGPIAIVSGTAGASFSRWWGVLVLVAASCWPGTWLLELGARMNHSRAAASAPNAELLASRVQRLLAALVDGGLFLVASTFLFATLMVIVEEPHEALGLACLLPLPVAQWVLISRHGQSIGKKLLGLRIVKPDGSPVGFLHGVLLREWLLYPFRVLAPLGGALAFGDPLASFRRSRRCLHDDIAGTYVVRARPRAPIVEDPSADRWHVPW